MNILFASKLKGLVTNINNNLVIIRRVNTNASPDVPKPLYQWGGCASLLIQSFGCTDSARAIQGNVRKCLYLQGNVRECKEMLENAKKCEKMQENRCVKGTIMNCYKTLQTSREMLKR
jgi:uncharacterized protein YkvS